jgi:hypothetical protein
VLFSNSFCLYVSRISGILIGHARTQNVNKRADWLTLFALVTTHSLMIAVHYYIFVFWIFLVKVSEGRFFNDRVDDCDWLIAGKMNA